MMMYFTCYGRLYRCSEKLYREILEMVASKRPFNLSDIISVQPLGSLGIDVGKSTPEQATKELARAPLHRSQDRNREANVGQA